MKSLVIAQDQAGEFRPARVDITTYDQLTDAIGGWLEAVPTDDTVTMWCNEEGKLKRLAFNELATEFWKRVDSFNCIAAGDFVVGPIVIQGPVDTDGETTDCPEWVFEVFGV